MKAFSFEPIAIPTYTTMSYKGMQGKLMCIAIGYRTKNDLSESQGLCSIPKKIQLGFSVCRGIPWSVHHLHITLLAFKPVYEWVLLICLFPNLLTQGLCEQTVKVLQLMEHDGIEPNLIMLNVLINAFGIAGRHLEALSVYQHIKETVCPLNLTIHLKLNPFMLIIILNLPEGY